MAERVGFEPTVGFPLHSLSRRALSTAQTPLRGFSNPNRRSLRSPTQSRSEKLPPRGEKRLQDCRALVCENAGGNIDAVVQARVVKHFKARSHSATLRIVAPIYQTRHTSLNHSACAHAARFQRDVQGGSCQSVVDEL